MFMRLVVATKNKGKAVEFAQMLSPLGWDVSHLGDRHDVETVDETGSTFVENASLKATGYAKRLGDWALGDWVLADDSGLVVDALGGEPGVNSAIYAKLNHAGEGDAANNALLLQKLNDVKQHDRTARFVCVLALSDPQGRIVLTTRGEVEGRIVFNPRGQGGFGYDPLFEVDAYSKTTAELSADQKHAISHRGKALRQMIELMKQYVK
jgi:XTP/dITP diphosphohydrolase